MTAELRIGMLVFCFTGSILLDRGETSERVILSLLTVVGFSKLSVDATGAGSCAVVNVTLASNTCGGLFNKSVG